jgi:bleomycin hydrolase
MKRLNVDKFELSQSYLMFWDKLEKANYFLETILATLDEPTDGRLIMFLLQSPLQDGGQWDMFVNLVEKYGVVPKSVMPETESSGNTGSMTALMTALLREDAAELRRMHAGGAGQALLRERKQAMLGDFYRMLCIHLGEPPRSFAWQWRDKENVFHRDGELTPLEFYARYVQYDLDALACLIHCPTGDKPINRLYTIQHLGNVVEGHVVRYLNVDLPVFKQAAVDMLTHDQPVWFGCDVGKMLERDLGILDLDLYDYRSVYGVDFKAGKAERVEYGHSLMTHAMVFTGVDLDDAGKPLKWRVENSWGDKIGDKGFLVMSDGWFDAYMYEVVVDKRFIPTELLPLLETDPVALPPWDPMGALAAAE